MSLTIRLASSADAPQICGIYSPIVRDTAVSFEQAVPDAKAIAARISETLQQYPWLVCEINRQIAGYAYAGSFRPRSAYQWTTETTVYVHPNYQRRGIARALYTSLIAVLRRQGYCNAIGVIALPNDGSVGAPGFDLMFCVLTIGTLVHRYILTYSLNIHHSLMGQRFMTSWRRLSPLKYKPASKAQPAICRASKTEPCLLTTDNEDISHRPKARSLP